MWSFFGLLFFGGIFVITCMQDFIYDIISSTERMQQQVIADRIVIDYGDEGKLVREVFQNKETYVKELSKIDDDMKFVFGDNWEDWYSKSLFSSFRIINNFSFEEGMTYNIYLASKGYISRSGKLSGYTLMGGDDSVVSQKIRALMVIEKHMRQHYPDLNPEIIILPDLDKKCTNQIQSCEAFWNFFQGKKAKERKYRGLAKKLSDLDPKLWNNIDNKA